MMEKQEIPEMMGTPMPVKTPINFKALKDKLQLQNEKAMQKLIMVSFVSVFFIIAQLIGGYLAQSIAIFTDSAHLASDLVGFAISIISLRMASKPATKSLSFGYHRAEVAGTLVSIIFIWGLTIWLVQEATYRIIYPQEVLGGTMLVVAIMGLIFNLIQMKILHSGEGHYHLGGDHDHGHSHGHGHDHGHEHDHHHEEKKVTKKKHSHGVQNEELMENLLDREQQHHHEHGKGHDHHHSPGHHKSIQEAPRWNINVTSAYLHVLGDMLMSVGVIIAALIIYINPNLNIVDPICTYLFSVIVLVTTIPVFRECIFVLLEGTPGSIDIEQLEEDILNIPGVKEVHDFHVWAISVNKYSLSAHIISETPLKSLSMATDVCRRKYNLYHTTIQVEGPEESKHYFKCEHDLHD